MSIGVSCGNIKVVQNFSSLHQFLWNIQGKLVQKPGCNMSPSLLTQGEMQCLHRLFGTLLRGKAGPFMSFFTLGGLGLLQIPLCLGKPVPCTVWQWLSPETLPNTVPSGK